MGETKAAGRATRADDAGGKAAARKVALTKSIIDALTCPAGRADVHVYDAKVTGLAYRLTSNGARSWYLVRRIAGRPQRVRLGGSELTVEQARTAAAKLNGEIAAGGNPVVDRQTVRRGGTLGELWESYRDKHLKLRASTRTLVTDESHWRTSFAPWAKRAALSVTEADVRALHASVGAERGQTMANRSVQFLRRMYNWARLPANPAATGVVRLFRETSRDRFVQPDELPKLFAALESPETSETVRDFVRVALLTGARRSNVQAMRDDEVNVAAAVWTIPQSKSKNATAMRVPLSDAAMAIIRPRLGHPSGYVFPGGGRAGHITNVNTAWKSVLRRAGLTDLHLHDLRRTLGSWQAAGGASLSIIGASLGHRGTHATSIYARLNLDPVRASVVNATDAMLAAAKGEPAKAVPATVDVAATTAAKKKRAGKTAG